MFTRWMLFQWVRTIKIQLSVLAQYKVDIIFLYLTYSHLDMAENCPDGAKQ
jgi:hypothetical protein